MRTEEVNNPLDFEGDLPPTARAELDLHTTWARRRLLEREISIAAYKQAFLAGEQLDRPPLLIPDFPARLVEAEMRSYYTNTVIHYRAYCAALARFGQDYVFPYTCTWEYRVVERLGGQVAQLAGKAPETTVHPITGPEDLARMPSLDFDELLSWDLAMKRYVDKTLGDLLGPGTFVILDPFSEAASLLRDPQALMLDLFDRPDFVHGLCSYAFEMVRQVMKRVLAAGPTIFFMPGYTLMLSPRDFKEFALPYIDRLVEEFPGTPIILGSGGNATHLIEPLMASQVPIPFIDAASDLSIAVEQARKHGKPFTVLFPRSVLLTGHQHQIRAVTRQLLSTVKDVPFYYWSEAILGGDAPNSTIDLFIEAYRDYARYPFEKYLDQEPEETPAQAIEAQAIDLKDVSWTPEGEEALKKAVPFVFRGMARRNVEKMAAAEGIRSITAEVFARAKKEAGY